MGWWLCTAVSATWFAWVVGVTSWRIPRSDAAVSVKAVGTACGVSDCAITRCEIERRQKACRMEAIVSSGST